MSKDRFEIPVPADYAAGGFIGDCYSVDENNNVDPDYHIATPVHATAIGEFYALLSEFE